MLRAISAAIVARHPDDLQAAAGDIGQQGRGTIPGGFLEHEIVALQIHRIARYVERNVIVAAE